MTWNLRIARRAAKELAKLPDRDQRRIIAALRSMRVNPFQGDIGRLVSERTAWRRRVSSYRIFFDLDLEDHVIDVVEISRRTSITY